MRWTGVGAVMAALAIGVSGCGGSNDAGSTTTDATAIETTALTDTSGVDTTVTDTTMTDTSETDTTSAAAGLSGQCKDLVAASEKFAGAAASATGVDSGLDATAKAFDALVATAPTELKDDFEALAGVISQYAEALKDLNLKPGEVPNSAQIAELAKLGQSFATEKVQKAAAAIQAWVTTNCSTTP